jgi:serine/threonine protein kinase
LFTAQQEKFRKEARRLFDLNNKHLVRVHDLFEENGTTYYVMDYIEGEPLSSILKRQNHPFDESEVMAFLNQILEALDEIHQHKIWHLDLKPSNILIDKNKNVVLIDFGASKQMGGTGGYTTTTGAMCYTPGYAPLEQVDQNIPKIGPWTDLYALGATLYCLLTNEKPPINSELNEPDAFKFLPNTSEKMCKLVKWMMSPARLERPQSVKDILNYLSKETINTSNDNINESTFLTDSVDDSAPLTTSNDENTIPSDSIAVDESTISTKIINDNNIVPNETEEHIPTHTEGRNKGYTKAILGFLLGAFIFTVFIFLYFQRCTSPSSDTIPVDSTAVDSLVNTNYYEEAFDSAVVEPVKKAPIKTPPTKSVRSNADSAIVSMPAPAPVRNSSSKRDNNTYQTTVADSTAY